MNNVVGYWAFIRGTYIRGTYIRYSSALFWHLHLYPMIRDLMHVIYITFMLYSWKYYYDSEGTEINFFLLAWHSIWQLVSVIHALSYCPSLDLLDYLQKIFNFLLRSQKVKYFFHPWSFNWTFVTCDKMVSLSWLAYMHCEVNPCIGAIRYLYKK
jgi:hypothetical protein